MKARLATKTVTTLLIIVAASRFGAQAQTAVNWNGGSGNWSASADWSGGVVPNNGGGKTYNVTISNGTAEIVTLDLGVTISDLTLGTSATLQSSGNNSLTIATGGTFTNSGTLTFNTGSNVLTIQSGGTLTNNGSMTLSGVGSGLKVTGNTTNAAGASITLEGGSTSTLTGNVNNSGIFQTGFSGGNNLATVTGTFTNNSGAQLILNASGDVLNLNALNNSGKLNIGAGATLTITGGGNGVTDVVAGSTYNISGNFNVKNGSTTTNALAKLTSVEGALTLNTAPNLTITPMGGTLTINKTGGFSVEGAMTLSLTGNVNNSGSFTTGFSGGNNLVTVSGTFTNNSGAQLNVEGSGDVLNLNALSNSGTLGVAVGATLNLTGGGNGVTDVVAGSTYNITGNFNVKNGSTTTNALAKLTTVEGALTLNAAPALTITPMGGTLTINNTGGFSVESAMTLSLTGNVNNSGSFTTGFSGGSDLVTVSGTFTNNSGAQLNVEGSGDVLNLKALSNSGTLGVAALATLNITGGGNGITDVVAGSTINLSGTLNVKNGSTTTNGLAKLTGIEGTLNLQNGQSTTMTPAGGILTISKTGLLSINNASTLAVTGNVNNSGTITSGFLGANNTVSVSGTFNNATGATLNVDGTGDVMNVATLSNAGTVTIANPTNAATLVITGTGSLMNSGNVGVSGGTLKFSSSSASLTGGGTVTLNAGDNTTTGTIQVGATDTGTLTNVNNTITGGGNLGNGTLTLVNQGTINANGQVNQGSLTIQPGSSGVTNTGTLEATNQGTLVLTGTFKNTGGTIQALGESGGLVNPTVQLTAGTVVTGGTLTTTAVGSNAGIIEGLGAVTLNGVTNSGTYDVNAGTTTKLLGTITNNGSINLSGSTLSMGNSVTLNGKGTVVLSNSASNLITGATSGLTLTNANTIEGAGTISNLGIVNTGTLAANQSTPLIILPTSAGLNNKGTLSVSTADTMQIGTSAGGALVNFSGTTLTGGTYSVGGTLQFGASGTSLVSNAANITLTGSGAKIIDFGGNNILKNFATNASSGSFTLAGGANFTTAGGFTNNGQLTASSGTKFTVTGPLTNFNSTTNTLTGGTYTVGGKLLFAGANIVTDAANITLQGAGEIVNSTNNSNGLAGLATIASSGSFALASRANFTTAGNFTDNGKLTVNSGSTMTVTGSLTNFNSSTKTLSSGTYTVGGTFGFTGANVVNNAANLTLTGTSAKILNGTTNGLANFANNTGTFTLSGNANLTTGSTNFSNTGTAVVSKGSTLTVGGTNNSYNQSSSKTTVDGTVSTTGSGQVNVTGGTLLGAGTLSTSGVTIGGSGTAPTLSVGDTGKAGLLAITGSYTQLSTGTLNVFVGGTTVGTQYSQLKVTGAASLAGTLTVALAGGFTPTLGSTFTVLTANSVAGTFSNSTIAINSTEHFNVSYTSTGVVLTVASGPTSKSRNGVQPSVVVALPPKPRPILSSALWRTMKGGGVIADIRRAGARSNAILGREHAVRCCEGSTRPSVLYRSTPARVATWEHNPAWMGSGAKLPVNVARLNQSAGQANNWIAPVRGTSWRESIPASRTVSRQVQPMRMLPLSLPRIKR